jgi:hypothetical protein
MKLLIMQFSPTSCHFISLHTKTKFRHSPVNSEQWIMPLTFSIMLLRHFLALISTVSFTFISSTSNK